MWKTASARGLQAVIIRMPRNYNSCGIGLQKIKAGKSPSFKRPQDTEWLNADHSLDLQDYVKPHSYPWHRVAVNVALYQDVVVFRPSLLHLTAAAMRSFLRSLTSPFAGHARQCRHLRG
ncbi:hypothetical protein MCOR25_000203 [Pyricularia grisea]|nr:hypothetical protein MCOR25_000203 [Pyricularia grisea]